MAKDLATLEQWYRENQKTGIETITQEDLPMPTLSIVQKTSERNLSDGTPATLGKFYYSATATQYDNWACYILDIHKELRGVYGDKSGEQKEWVYIVTGVSDDLQKPFVIIARRTLIGQVKGFLGRVVAEKKPVFSNQVILEAIRAESEKGPYYLMKFTIKGVEQDMTKLTTLQKLSQKFGNVAKEPAVPAEEESAFETPTKVETKEETDDDMPF